jgi:hypothetical protein
VRRDPRRTRTVDLPHGVSMSNDNAVSDRLNHRIQVFTFEGKIVNEGFGTRLRAERKLIYVPDGSDAKVRIP